jgi:hypothetical protein
MDGQFHVPDALSQGKNAGTLFNRRLGGSQSRSGCFEEKSFASTRIRNQDRSTRSQVTIPTMLPTLPVGLFY